MTRATVLRRLRRARLHHDERGFTLLETVIAVTVIFGSLLTLAYTATAGFTYQDIARQRQTANGLANQVMEEVRGLAYDRITTGLLDTDLASDPTYIVNCGGTPTVYRFQTCTTPLNTTTGAGEKIVYSAGATNPTTPLVPHHGTTTINNIAYDWYTYVTIDDTVASAPYRVTVRVTWTGGATAANKAYQLQSFFYSPVGCRSTSTHPFAAPCQPFVFGSATVPNGNINVTGTIEDLSFTSGDLFLTGATSSIEQEQLAQIQGTFHAPEASLTAGGTTTPAGGVTGTSLADSDPNTTTVSTYSRQRCPTELTCSGGAPTVSNNGRSITFTAPSNATAETDSTVSATATNVCPPPSDTGETDTQPCGGTRVTQVGTLSATATLPTVGSLTLAQLLAPSSPTKAIVNRQLFPSTSGCTPASTEDGCVATTATRTLGTLNIGGLPSNYNNPPAGWTGTNAWNGYFLSIVGYTETATASAGTKSPDATAAFTSGTLYYWNGTGYTSLSMTGAALNGLNASFTLTKRIDDEDTAVSISTVRSTMAAGSVSAVTTRGTPSTTVTEATAQVTPPVLAIHYFVIRHGETLADLTITVQLSVLEARGTYAPAPATGS